MLLWLTITTTRTSSSSRSSNSSSCSSSTGSRVSNCDLTYFDLCLLIPSGTKGSILAGPLQLGPCCSGSFYLGIGASPPSLLRETDLIRFPCGFQSRACLVMLDVGFRSVWPIQPHLRFLISVSIGVCFVLSHSCSFETTSGNLMLRMFLRHLLVNVCSLWVRAHTQRVQAHVATWNEEKHRDQNVKNSILL